MSRFVKTGIKLGLVGSVVYATTEYGLWRDSQSSDQLYKDLYSAASPYFQEVPVEFPEFPKSAEITRAAVDGWNRGVFATARFLSELPQTTAELSQKAYDAVKTQITSTSDT